MANEKRYTEAQLKRKFKGRYIDIYPHYDYVTKETTYEVRGNKKTIHENHNLPEVAISYCK